MMDWHALLVAEHRETERLLARLHDLITAAAWEEAGGLAAHTATDLLRHFALEEQALFPIVSQYRSMMLMEVEHDDLLSLWHRFQAELETSIRNQTENPRLLPSLQAFRNQLAGHMREEEHGIFPLAEKLLEQEEVLKVNRLFRELAASEENRTPVLQRPEPGFSIMESAILKPLEKPLAYQTLYDHEHAGLQHIWMRAGQSLARHWGGQHQCLIALSGRVIFQTDEKKTTMAPGSVARIDSRFPFSLSAEQDTHLLVMKVWPHPHYTKSSP